jgi:Family of unknown function (DUF6186)
MSTAAAVTVTAYLTAAVACVALQLWARRHPDRATTLGGLVTWAMRRRATQLAVVFVWWWFGWHLVTQR